MSDKTAQPAGKPKAKSKTAGCFGCGAAGVLVVGVCVVVALPNFLASNRCMDARRSLRKGLMIVVETEMRAKAEGGYRVVTAAEAGLPPEATLTVELVEGGYRARADLGTAWLEVKTDGHIPNDDAEHCIRD